MSFRKKSLITRLCMKQEKLNQYYRDKRKYEYENNIPIKGIGWRKRVHKLLIRMVALSGKISGRRLHILHDKRIKTNKPVIYSCTHVG